ncbi:MAG: hypothetical protein ACUVS3_16445 [Thermodesulfobacteriota bacterium]
MPGVFICLIRRRPVEELARVLLFLEVEAATDTSIVLRHRLVRLQIDLLILRSPPEPLQGSVVDPATLGCLGLVDEG